MNGHSEQAIKATEPTEEELIRLQDEEPEEEEEQEQGDPWDALTEEQQDMYLVVRQSWGW